MVTRVTEASSAGQWTLGDLVVNRLGFGAMRLTGSAAFDLGTPRDRGPSIATLRRAIELGVNHMDTAAFYFSSLRSANELINSALAPYPQDLVIVTKVGPGRDPSGAWTARASPEQLRGQVEENLRQLGLDCLSVVNFRATSGDSIAEHFGALADLRSAGLIRHLGLAGVAQGQLIEAQAIAPVVCVQNRYSLENRSDDTDVFIQRCGEGGVAYVPYFSIAGDGASKGMGPSERAAVSQVAAAHGATPAQVRIAWTLQLGRHVLAIPGTGQVHHLEENVAAAELRLSAADVALLEGQPDETISAT